MLAKKNAENQLLLPKEVAGLFLDTDYFDIEVENGRIVLKPTPSYRLEQVRNKIGALSITEEDIRDAIAWARGTRD